MNPENCFFCHEQMTQEDAMRGDVWRYKVDLQTDRYNSGHVSCLVNRLQLTEKAVDQQAIAKAVEMREMELDEGDQES